MNDKVVAQIGACVYFTQNMLNRIQIISRRNSAPLAFGYTEQAFLELLQDTTHDSKKSGSLARRMRRGADTLYTLLRSFKDADGKPEFTDEPIFIGIVRFMQKAKNESLLPIVDGTHTAYLFQELGKNIDALAGQILEDADDIPKVISVIEKWLEQV